MRHDEEAWFHRLNVDFAKPGEARVLVGFLKGDPDDSEKVRLFLTLDLDDYIEIRMADVLGSHSLENAQNPLAGTAVWVKRAAQLRLISTERRTDQGPAEFIRGAIVRRYLRGAGLAGLHKWWRELTPAYAADIAVKTPQSPYGCGGTMECTAGYTECDPCQAHRDPID